MDQRPSADRRRHVRHPLATAVRFHHGPSSREFPARSVDVSGGGMLVYLPVGTPVAAGQSVRVAFACPEKPEFDPLRRQPLAATVIRVDRKRLPQIGYLPVGVKFEPETG